MTITKGQVVEIEYTLKDAAGEILDTSKGKDPLVYLHGYKNIIPGLEKQLEGQKEGALLNLTIEPSEAYGHRTQELVNSVPKEELSQIPDLEVGMQLQAQGSQGVQIVTVVDINDDTVTLDANHPLADQTLYFDIEVLSVRAGTAEEKSHGHVHGVGGHQH